MSEGNYYKVRGIDRRTNYVEASRTDKFIQESRLTVSRSTIPALLQKEPDPILDHPLAGPLLDAIRQATSGKGVRHGGSSIPFYEQSWLALAKAHGYGFLSGQAAKKLNEAASRLQVKTPVEDGEFSILLNEPDEATEREVLGAIVYLGMYLLAIRNNLK